MLFKRLIPIAKKHSSFLISILAVIILFAILFLLGITCPIKYLFGISCAGCGMTRAWLSAVRLNFSAAFYYHPLWFLVPFLLVLGIFLYTKRKKRALIFLIGLFVVLMLAVYFMRLFGNSEIVVFAPQDGALLNKIIN